MIELVELEPSSLERGRWESLHEFRRLRHQEVDPEDPLIPDDIYEKEMTHVDKMRESVRHIALDGERIVGLFRFRRATEVSPDYEEKKEEATIFGELIADYRRNGVGTRWALAVAELARSRGVTRLTSWAHEESGHRFLSKLGGEPRMRERENRLDLEQLDWSMVERWVEEGMERNPDVQVTLYEDRLPVEILEEYCPVLTEIFNDMPLEELETGAHVFTPEMFTSEILPWLDRLGAHHHTVIVREPDGAISAQTDVFHQPATPTVIDQWATGVLRPYRGRGLGRLVKARMLLYLRDRYPQARYMKTENAGSNEPMLAINDELGFKVHREIVAYQLSTDQLERALRAD